MEKIELISKDGYKLNVHAFVCDNEKGIVQIIHGMEEHQERYEPFVKKLNEEGYSVYTSNMRGHGDDAPLLGFFASKDGYKELLEDQKIITKYIMKRHKTNKINLFAHSMGTIIARNLLQSESYNYEKVVLSGYPCPQGAAGMGIFFCNCVMAFRGPKYFSKFLESLAVGSFNKKIKNPKTKFDWLSYNEENVKNYMNDPYCGHGFKVSALKDLFILVERMAKPSLYNEVNKELPLLMLRGDSDPCTGFDKGSLNSINILKKAGFKNIVDNKFEHMRHEILNEDLDKVSKKVIDFLK